MDLLPGANSGKSVLSAMLAVEFVEPDGKEDDWKTILGARRYCNKREKPPPSSCGGEKCWINQVAVVQPISCILWTTQASRREEGTQWIQIILKRTSHGCTILLLLLRRIRW